MQQRTPLRAMLIATALAWTAPAAIATPINSPDGWAYPAGSSSYLNPARPVLIDGFGVVTRFYINFHEPQYETIGGSNGLQTMTANFFAVFRDPATGSAVGSVDLPGNYSVEFESRPNFNDTGVFFATTQIASFAGPIGPGLFMEVDLDPAYPLPLGLISVVPNPGGSGYLFDVEREPVVYGRYRVNGGRYITVGLLQHGVPVPATSALLLVGLAASYRLRRRTIAGARCLS